VDKFGLACLIIAVGLYLLSFARWSVGERSESGPVDHGNGNRQGLGLVYGAGLAHGLGLLLPLITHVPPRFGFAQALCATLWVALAFLVFEARRMDARSLFRLHAPVAALACGLAVFFPGQLLPLSSARLSFIAHLLLGTAAYGVLLLAALHALLMVSAQKSLQSNAGAESLQGSEHPWSGLNMLGPVRLIGELPPLMVLERSLFSLSGLGFVLLSLTLLSGTVFSSDVFGRAFRLDHKTLFTLLAWLVFAVLLLGRRLQGWRGRTALRFTLLGFGLLLLGYVGSRFVLEVLLGR
jgi:ABC-type uncharacterized transport system permease subunit